MLKIIELSTSVILIRIFLQLSMQYGVFVNLRQTAYTILLLQLIVNYHCVILKHMEGRGSMGNSNNGIENNEHCLAI